MKKSSIAILTVSVLCILMVVLVHFNPGFERYASAVTPFFMLQPESVTEEAIDEYAGVRRTYTFTIPEAENATTTGSRLFAYLRHTQSEVSIEDSSLYNDMAEKDSFHIGETPGNYWLEIPVRPAFAGKTLTITLTPVYDSVRNEQPMFMIITRDMLLTMLVLPENGLLLVLGIVAASAGLFLLLISLALPLQKKDKYLLICLGAVTCAAGIWKLCGLPAATLLMDYYGIHKELWFAGAVSYILMMVLSLRLLTIMRDDEKSRSGNLVFCIGSTFAVLLLVLQIFNILELHNVLIWYGLIIALLHLISLFGQKPTRSELLWLLPFFLSLGVDLIIYLVTGSMQYAPAFLIWMILNLFVRGFGFIREAINREKMLRMQEEELRDSRVQMMINQIRPHFIYNTLSSVYVLCRDDPELAMKVIQDFTSYLQSNFTAISAKEPISFNSELEHTKAYVAVESLRYGDKLSVDYDIRFTAFRLPALTLQPLVENAVKHCLGKGIGPEHICVRSRLEDEWIVIIVEDNGPGIEPDDAADSETHIGLQNVRERLELMCSGKLDLKNRRGSGTIVTITLPLRKS